MRIIIGILGTIVFLLQVSHCSAWESRRNHTSGMDCNWRCQNQMLLLQLAPVAGAGPRIIQVPAYELPEKGEKPEARCEPGVSCERGVR